ncbi:MAG: hypothetical protein K2P23_12180, partial [Lachnospiraceae bacterium]|nr:hypothetical protein [Lachnospiraceae bacterium]
MVPIKSVRIDFMIPVSRNLGGTAVYSSHMLVHMGFFVVIIIRKGLNAERIDDMKEKLEQLKAEALRQIEASDALEKLNEV